MDATTAAPTFPSKAAVSQQPQAIQMSACFLSPISRATTKLTLHHLRHTLPYTHPRIRMPEQESEPPKAQGWRSGQGLSLGDARVFLVFWCVLGLHYCVGSNTSCFTECCEGCCDCIADIVCEYLLSSAD